MNGPNRTIKTEIISPTWSAASSELWRIQNQRRIHLKSFIVNSRDSSDRKKIDLSNVVIKPLDPETDRAAFCCGHTKIDNFCKNNAKKQNASNRVRAYDACYEKELIGYYYLVASTHLPEEVSKQANEKFGRVKSAPCVYLGMIGVKENYQGSGVGRLLMLHAMRNTLRVADIIGLYALTLHADNKDVAERYKGWGFEYFDEGDLAMYMPIGTIRDALRT